MSYDSLGDSAGTKTRVKYTEVDFKLTATTRVRIRSGPGTGTKHVGWLNKGDIVRCNTEANDSANDTWVKHDKGGWTCVAKGKTTYLSYDAAPNGQRPSPQVAKDNQASVAANGGEDLSYVKADNFQTNLKMDVNLYKSQGDALGITNMVGVYGLPYQFLPNVDTPISTLSNNTSKIEFGREYADMIISKMPLLTVSPGKAEYMTGFKIEEKKNFLNLTYDLLKGDLIEEKSASKVDELLQKSGRYYTFLHNYAEYYQFVNNMCSAQAKLLGLHKNYVQFDWSKAMVKSNADVKSGVKGFFSGNEYICFYVEAEDQITESFSNSTTESMLARFGDKVSELSKEMDTLLGVGFGVESERLHKSENVDFAYGDELLKGGFSKHFMEKTKGDLKVMTKGGSLAFPEIYSDSDYSKSYDVTIKLQSPDGDDESIFNNIMVPLWHIIGFSLPRQSGPNGYRTPFLIRANYRGIFNVEMGIVTSLSIRKGANGAWSASDLPTEVEVTMTIKDLYTLMSIATAHGSWKNTREFVNNTQLMDFIANMSGININKPEFLRKVDMYTMAIEGKFKHLGRNTWLGVSEKASNTLMKLFGY